MADQVLPGDGGVADRAGVRRVQSGLADQLFDALPDTWLLGQRDSWLVPRVADEGQLAGGVGGTELGFGAGRAAQGVADTAVDQVEVEERGAVGDAFVEQREQGAGEGGVGLAGWGKGLLVGWR